jgi:alpha-L-fucosidase
MSTAQDAPIGVIEHDLGGPKTFNVAKIRENTRYGQRIEAFAFDVWDGKDWVEIARGTAVGYQKLLRFRDVEAAKVRVRILKIRDRKSPLLFLSLLGVPLDSFGLYHDPGH